ncbi:hypothetical protein F383_24839 [Gossypium arboreum]|uniref:Uncharacterized protein n=1 Tax=Gossypium arboreum TaxID=29729 RepID=A0A0B0NZM3_GOSAR|nr:hypothetical protein F383_24839 [Gossypium arboreum]
MVCSWVTCIVLSAHHVYKRATRHYDVARSHG